MTALPGIRAWLAPVYGPKRRYEAPTCARDFSHVYADEMTALQVRHVLAKMIDPKHIVSGWMPRRVHVTDGNGVVKREITAEQLGVKLIARGAVEFAIDGEMLPSTVCPKCGGRKMAASKTCFSCSPLAPKGRSQTCACGARKERTAAKCFSCSGRAKRSKFCVCGGEKSPSSSKCRQCAGTAPMPEARVCSCGAPKRLKSSRCKACSGFGSRVDRARCQCGAAKDHRASLCMACRSAARPKTRERTQEKVERIDRCAILRAAGKSAREIASELGISRPTVKAWLALRDAVAPR